MKAGKIKIAVALAVLLLLAFVASACKSEEQIAQDNNEKPTVISPDVNITQEAPEAPDVLNVSGSGKVVLAPDTATFYVEIYTEAKEAAQAQSDNAAVTSAVTVAILAAGVAEKDLQTYNVNLSEIYNYEKTPYVITGYSMRTTLFVTVKNIDSTGKVMGDAIAAGATGTRDLSFTVSDTSGAYQQALQAAIADAAGKAKAMAETLGVTLSTVPVSVTENSASEPIIYENPGGKQEMADDAGVEMPISTGQITVTARVGVVYEMLAGGAQ